MDAQQTAIAQARSAQACLTGAYANTLSFPQSVEALSEVGFEAYAVDYRCNTRTHYLPSGETLVLHNPHHEGGVAETFDGDKVSAAIRWAQLGPADYDYNAFNLRVTEAGCAGYLVSIVGRRVLYFGRTGETHTEHFPQ